MSEATGRVVIDGLLYSVIPSSSSVEVSAENKDIVSADIRLSVTIEGQTYSVSSIAAKGFQSCSGLTSVNVPLSVREVGEAAFWGCRHITAVEVPCEDSVLDDGAFHGCVRLASVGLPSRLLTISEGTFLGCEALSSIVIPSTVNTVEDNAFSGCSGLKTIQSLASVPPVVLGDNAFQGVPKNKCVLYVPKGALSQYEVAQGWTEFSNIVETETSSISGVTSTSAEEISCFSPNGQLRQSRQRGLNLVKLNDGTVKKIAVK